MRSKKSLQEPDHTSQALLLPFVATSATHRGRSLPHAALRGHLQANRWVGAHARQALLDYIMICCQCEVGGLRDKPGKGRDHYHTCYCLSGASVAASMLQGEPSATDGPSMDGSAAEADHHPRVEIPAEWKSTRLVNPVYNVAADKADRALAYFSNLPPIV